MQDFEPLKKSRPHLSSGTLAEVEAQPEVGVVEQSSKSLLCAARWVNIVQVIAF